MYLQHWILLKPLCTILSNILYKLINISESSIGVWLKYKVRQLVKESMPRNAD